MSCDSQHCAESRLLVQPNAKACGSEKSIIQKHNTQFSALGRNFYICQTVGLCACARPSVRCPLCLAGTVRLVPPLGRHVAVPRALLAAPVASTSTSTAARCLCRRRAVLIQPDPPPLMAALLPRGRLGVGGGGVQCRGARAEPRSTARGWRSAAGCRRHRLPQQRDRRRYVAYIDERNAHT